MTPNHRDRLRQRLDWQATAMLASVVDVGEARLAAMAGADIIDCKSPEDGALGALPLAVIAAIRKELPAAIPVSATIGDLPPEPEALASAVAVVAATGVDYVKVGFFAGGAPSSAIRRLAKLQLDRVSLVGVLLADLQPDIDLIDEMAAAGFAGVIVDTADKRAGSLPDLWNRQRLAEFLGRTRARGMFAGFAGALRLKHVAPLMQLEPDIIGFRGALCRGHDRVSQLDRQAVELVRTAMRKATVDALESVP